ncbi:hypothetical protein ACWN9M_05990 [Leuconostoc lactis]
MKIVILYGIYQHFGLLFNLPFSNNFFANNTSFSTIDLYETASGWNGGLRISAIWSEPAGSAVAVSSFVALLLHNPDERKVTKFVWSITSIMFAYWTYSRLLWVALGIVFILFFLKMIFSDEFINRFIMNFKYFWIFILMVGLLVYLNNAMKYSTDLSALSRSQSILVGWEVFLKHPLIGIGFGNFYQYAYLYPEMFSIYKPMDLILGTFSNYAATLGITGLIISLIPLFAFVRGSRKNFVLGFTWCCLLIAIGMIGSDIYSTSMVWLLIVMWNAIEIKVKRKYNE